jgi:hypothetical protein
MKKNHTISITKSKPIPTCKNMNSSNIKKKKDDYAKKYLVNSRNINHWNVWGNTLKNH